MCTGWFRSILHTLIYSRLSAFDYAYYRTITVLIPHDTAQTPPSILHIFSLFFGLIFI